MYSIFDYGRMIADPVRMNAYEGAIQASVGPGMTVLDLGTGTGVFALLACRAGARRVYAVDPTPAVQLGREVARANGFDTRIVFIQGRSSAIDLPEPVDRIVSDMRGIVPFYGTHLTDIIDARDRFLAPGGKLIPRRDTVYGALAEAPDQYSDFTSPWSNTPLDFDMAPACRYLLNTWKKARRPACRVVSPPCRWTTIDYGAVDRIEGTGRLFWPVEAGAVAHGFLLWFETSLDGAFGFSNAPGQPESIYGQAFFPFRKPLDLCPGNSVQIDLQAAPVGEDYIWRWRSVHFSSSGARKTAFDQSTFHSTPVSSETLAKKEERYRPRLSDHGLADRFILSLIDGSRTLRQIAEALYTRFPDLYPTPHSAFEHVAHIAGRYDGNAHVD